MRQDKPSALLFDLDGTLLDTAPDFYVALSRLLQKYNQPTPPFEEMRTWVSLGAYGMLQRGFGLKELDHPLLKSLTPEFIAYYQETISTHTRLFEGMNEVLCQLENQYIPWGIVTNKPDVLTQCLLKNLNLTKRAGTIVSGDTLAVTKPHPEPLWYACEILKVKPEDCLYVGDAKRDIEAAIAAGMPGVVATYGYILPEEDPFDWGAKAYIEHPSELLELLS